MKITLVEMRHRVLAPLAAVAAISLAGCGTNTSETVKGKLNQFANAVASHDYATICNQVLSQRLLVDIAAGGLTCQRAMQLGFGSVQDARLVIGQVTVHGKSASALTLSQAKGQKTEVATVQLVDGPTGWRIDSLGNA